MLTHNRQRQDLHPAYRGHKRKLTESVTSVGGVWMHQSQKSSPGPGLRCEVLTAGTNDLTVGVGTQSSIYRHLDGFIAGRQANTEVVVYVYIEEFAARYNTRVLNLGGGGDRPKVLLEARSTSNNEGQAAAGWDDCGGCIDETSHHTCRLQQSRPLPPLARASRCHPLSTLQKNALRLVR
ncbi:hypothetical protein J6590_080271 [Homalodisca vitripennis]|nr:hypothetical protein J6590_080271 [Homalodisca vitripennis]